MSDTRRQRLHVDVPDAMNRSIRETAERYYRGTTSDAVQAAIAMFGWVVRQRAAGRRVIAVDADHLPDAFVEPVIPGLEEALAPRWDWLIARPHSWRRQLAIKGRRIYAGQLARDMDVNGWSPDEAARQFDLPIGAVLEAQLYAAENADLIKAEEAENRMAAIAASTEAIPVKPHAPKRRSRAVVR